VQRDGLDFWVRPEAVSSFQIPEVWWNRVDAGERNYWMLVGVDVESRSYEVSDVWSFTKSTAD
jgi:hypothetical protein